MKTFLKSLLILAFALASAGSAQAAVFGNGAEYLLDAGETVRENLYVGAASVTIAGSVRGDAYLTGGTIIITADVKDDATLVGGQVSIHADIGEDLRIGGGTVVLDGNVGGDAILGGGTVTILPESVILGDTVITAGQVIVHGNVQRDLTIMGGEVVVNGIVNGDVEIRAKEAIRFGSGAAILGDFEYSAPKELEAVSDVVRGDVVYMGSAKKMHGEKGLPAFFGAILSITLVMVLVTTSLLYGIAPGFTQRIVDSATKNPLRHFGRGALTVILAPILIVASFITIVGIPFGFFWLLAFLIISSLAKAAGGLVFGAYVLARAKKRDSVELSWKVVLLSVIGYHIIVVIPVVGLIVAIATFGVVYGTLVQMIREKLWEKR